LVKSVNRRDPSLQFGWRDRAAQAPGRSVEGRSVMHLNVLGDTHVTMAPGGRGWLERVGGAAMGVVVGTVGWKGPHEPGTPRRRISTECAE